METWHAIQEALARAPRAEAGAVHTLWDLALGLLPVALAWTLAWGWRRTTPAWRLAWLPLIGAWLLLLPNAAYLLTELRKLHDPAELLYVDVHDPTTANERLLPFLAWTLFYVLASLSGLPCYALAVQPLLELARECRLHVRRLLVPLSALASLGVYAGLTARLNSWDVFNRRPLHLVRLVLAPLLHPGEATLYLLLLAGVLYGISVGTDIWFAGRAVCAMRPAPDPSDEAIEPPSPDSERASAPGRSAGTLTTETGAIFTAESRRHGEEQ